MWAEEGGPGVGDYTLRPAFLAEASRNVRCSPLRRKHPPKLFRAGAPVASASEANGLGCCSSSSSISSARLFATKPSEAVPLPRSTLPSRKPIRLEHSGEGLLRKVTSSGDDLLKTLLSRDQRDS